MVDTEKIKKPIYKKWWFWIIIVLLVVVIGSNGSSDNNTSTSNYQKDTTVEITVATVPIAVKINVQSIIYLLVCFYSRTEQFIIVYR